MLLIALDPQPRNFIALIYKDAGSDYGVSFPDLPGCVTAGLDLDEARRMAEEALALHSKGTEADRDPIPEPSSLEAIMRQNRENRGAVAILVTPRQGGHRGPLRPSLARPAPT